MFCTLLFILDLFALLWHAFCHVTNSYVDDGDDDDDVDDDDDDDDDADDDDDDGDGGFGI